jgi:hypothetical protein
MFRKAGLQIEHTEEIIKRHPLIPWASRQGCTQERIERLRKMLAEAPPIAQAWLYPLNLNTSDASFTNHHLLISGRKLAY